MIDSHFHIWRLARGDYGWLTPKLAPIYRDVSVADWIAQARPLRVTRGILVQAAPTEAETRFLLAQAHENADIVAGVVGWVDMMAGDAADRIAALAQDAKLVGLRPMLHDLDDPMWVLDVRLKPAIEAIIAANLTFDALIRPVHLPHILTLARRHPRLRIVVDHGAKPEIRAGALEPWATEIAQLANETSAFCKVSGLLTEAQAGASAETLRPCVDHLVRVFGPRRLLWGSDWPVLELASDYATWHAMATQLISSNDRDAIFGRTARDAYPRVR